MNLPRGWSSNKSASVTLSPALPDAPDAPVAPEVMRILWLDNSAHCANGALVVSSINSNSRTAIFPSKRNASVLASLAPNAACTRPSSAASPLVSFRRVLRFRYGENAARTTRSSENSVSTLLARWSNFTFAWAAPPLPTLPLNVPLMGRAPLTSMRSTLMPMASTTCVSAAGSVLSVKLTRPLVRLMPAMLTFTGVAVGTVFAAFATGVRSPAGANFFATSTPVLSSASVTSGATMSIFGNSIFVPSALISKGETRNSLALNHAVAGAVAALSRIAISDNAARLPLTITLSLSPVAMRAPSVRSSFAVAVCGVAKL